MLEAFIDESGDRGITKKSSDYFVVSAILVEDALAQAATDLLAQIRHDLNRHPGDTMSWKNIKSHSQKLHAVQLIGGSPFTISSVVVCKRHLSEKLPTETLAYLYSVRFLLERLSWIAERQHTSVAYTLAQITRCTIGQLREYEETLRGKEDCQIHWDYIARPGRIDQPNRVEFLQLADLVASATAPAFEADEFGNTERRYLNELSPRLYRHGAGENALTSYGLKMHPWHEACRKAHPWVSAL